MSDWTTPPHALHADVHPRWRDVVAELQARAVLQNASPIAAALLAQQLHQYDKATAFLMREGMVLELRNDKGELKRREPAPEFRIQQQCLAQIGRLAKSLQLDAPIVDAPPPLPADGRQRLSALLSQLGNSTN